MAHTPISAIVIVHANQVRITPSFPVPRPAPPPLPGRHRRDPLRRPLSIRNRRSRCPASCARRGRRRAGTVRYLLDTITGSDGGFPPSPLSAGPPCHARAQPVVRAPRVTPFGGAVRAPQPRKYPGKGGTASVHGACYKKHIERSQRFAALPAPQPVHPPAGILQRISCRPPGAIRAGYRPGAAFPGWPGRCGSAQTTPARVHVGPRH